jgi:hypothetical protein
MTDSVVEDAEPLPAIRHPKLGEPVAVYRYARASGEVAFVVARFEPKDFRPAQRRNGRWVWTLDNAPALPYRLPLLEEALGAGDTIWIVDGEKDADALAAAGVTATCCARSQGWTVELAEQLTGARRVRIVADRDGNGTGFRQALEVRDLLVKAAAIASSDIELVEAADGKDAFDHLAAGYGLADFQLLDEPSVTHAPAAHSWLPIDLLGENLAEPEPPSIAGIVYPGRRHWWTGEPESLKTWAALVLVAGEIRAGRNAAYVDFEMGRREVLERLRALGLEDEAIRDRLIYLEPTEPLTGDALGDVHEILDARQPSLIVIDAAAGALALHGCDPNSGADIERFYRIVVGELRSRGAAIVVLDHLVKDREARGRYAIGSERKIGAADVHLRFEVTQPFGRGRTGRVRIETKKDRPGHLRRPRAADLELDSDPDTGAIRWEFTTPTVDVEPATFRPTVLMEKVSIYVERCVDPPSRNQVEKGITGKNTNAKRLAMDVLIREGHLAADDGPRSAKLLRVVRPYRQSDDPATSPQSSSGDLALTSPNSTPQNQAKNATSPDLALTSPAATGDDFAQLAPLPLQEGRRGEVEQDEIERLAALAHEAGA